MSDAALAVALRRDRLVVVLALAALTILSLGYVVSLTRMDMSGMMGPGFVPWSASHFLFMFGMWAVMMIGMMTPSVAPMVLLHAALARRSAAGSHPLASTGWFAAGYLLAWTVFALLATALQWGLEAAALVAPMMAGTSRRIGGAMLIAAGVYQWLPLKDACLTQCQAPLAFVQRHGGFQASASGAMRLGLRHGVYCIGCCWVLMLLLFAFGVMNLLWIAGLMAFVLLEKLLPARLNFARLAGAAVIAAGVWMML